MNETFDVACSHKDIIYELNKEVDLRKTSDEWWFDSCKCSVLLACLFWRTTVYSDI